MNEDNDQLTGWRKIREIIQESLKKNPLTPESIADMFDPIEEKRYYDMFMRIYEHDKNKDENEGSYEELPCEGIKCQVNKIQSGEIPKKTDREFLEESRSND